MKRRGSTQYTRQIGEAIVCSELGRRGYIASAFAGNVADFDLVAVDAKLRAIPIQVKAFQHADDEHPCWPITDRFLNISVHPRTKKQTVQGRRLGPSAGMVYIFVLLRDIHDPDTRDRFFVCLGRDVRRVALRHYKEFLSRHHGRRPRSPLSRETRLRPSDLAEFEDNWALLDRRARAHG